MKLEYDPKPASPKQAIVAAFDLSGFSSFCKQSDASDVVPKLIATLFKELNSFLMTFYKRIFSNENRPQEKVRVPDFIKYTGDAVRQYIRNQEKEDKRHEQLELVAP